MTLPLVAAGVALVKVGKDFDEAFDAIRATTGKTGKEFESLGSSFKAVLSTVPASMKDTTIAISDLHVRTGQTGTGLETLASQMLNLSRLTGAEIGPLIQTTTRLFGDWSIATEHQSGALDFLFRTSQATGIEVTRLSDLVVQFGAPLRALGFEFEQAAALMGKWEKEGVNLETVLSGLRFALGKFAKEGLEPAAALQQVTSAIQGAKTESEATAIAFQVFGKRAAVDMSRAIIEGRFNIDELVTSLKNGKETINGAAGATLSLGERFQLLGNRVMVALEPLAGRFVTALERAAIAAMPLVSAMSVLVGWFADLPGPIQTGILGFFALAAAIGPVTYAIGAVMRAGAGLISIWRTAGVASTGLAAAFGTASVASAGTVAGILALAAGFGLVAVKIHESIKAYGLWDTVVGGLRGMLAGGGIAGIGGILSGTARGPSSRGARAGTANTTTPGAVPDPAGDLIAQLETSKRVMDEASKRRPDLFPSAAGQNDMLDKLLKTPKDPLQPLRDQLSGADALGAAQSWMSVVREIGGITKLTADEQSQLNRVLGEALLKYAALGKVAPQAIVDTFFATATFAPKVLAGLNSLLDAQGRFMAGELVYPPPPLAGGPGVGPLTTLPGATGVTAQAPTLSGFFGRAFGSIGDFGAGLGASLLGGGRGITTFLGGGVGSQLSAMLGLASKNASGGFLASGFGKFASGALGSLLPGIGGLIGPLLGKVGGFFSNLFGGEGRKTKKARGEWIDQFGGLDKLKSVADEVGFSLDRMLSTKKVKDFEAEVGRLNKAMDDHKAKVEAIADIVSGVNARSKNLTGQGDLDVVGAGALAAFALQIQQGSSAVEAFNAITPAVTAMRDAMASNNLTASESVLRLLELGAILDMNAVQFTNLGATGQILQAMLQGNIRDGALFAAIATDIGTQIQTVIDRGVPMAQVFALAQPQLQALWEAQQKWGFSVDATTAALLKEAEAQGFVGVAMKSVNQQILDVLIAIGDTLGAKIPEALRGLPSVAAEAAAGMQAAFNTVTGPTIVVPDGGGTPVDQLDVPQLASGGIVRARPGGTLVNVGEGGLDEAVVPLGGGSARPATTVIIEMDSRTVAEFVVPQIPGVVQRYGLA